MTAERDVPPTATVRLKLDRRTLRHVEELAAAQQCTVEEFLEGLISRLEKPADPLLGLFRDAPQVLDQIVEEAMSARATHPLRQPRE
jgi:hypothetical protein